MAFGAVGSRLCCGSVSILRNAAGRERGEATEATGSTVSVGASAAGRWSAFGLSIPVGAAGRLSLPQRRTGAVGGDRVVTGGGSGIQASGSKGFAKHAARDAPVVVRPVRRCIGSMVG